MRSFLPIILLFLSPLGGHALTLDPARRTHTCEGWGVSLCWWAKECGQWPEERLDSLITWLVAPEGLNYNLFRYNIGGGDDPTWAHCSPHHFGAPGGKGLRAEMEGFQDERGGAYHWERDAAQRRILLMIKRRRPDAVFEAFSNSAPWWMTVSGCAAGAQRATDNNLRPDYYTDFAKYLVRVCQHYKEEYGLEFATLEPFNEPETDYWYQRGGQEGCHVSTSEQIRFLRVLAPTLQASGLRTVIAASDETAVRQSILDLHAYHRAGVLPLLGQWNTHTYHGTTAEKDSLARLAAGHGLRLVQSETGDGGNGLDGNLRMAQRLIDDIRHLRPAAWVDWQYVEENYDQWSLVSADHTWGQYRRHANYYVRQQFSRFVPAGYQWLQTDDPHALAAISPDDSTIALIAINADDSPRRLRLHIPRAYHIKEVFRTSAAERCQPVKKTLTLPAHSITTYLLRR